MLQKEEKTLNSRGVVTPGTSQEKWTGRVSGERYRVNERCRASETRDRKNSECLFSESTVNPAIPPSLSVCSQFLMRSRSACGNGARSQSENGWIGGRRWTV
jgi:hypothetical protein